MVRTILGAVTGVIAWYAAVIAVSLGVKVAAPDVNAALAVHATGAALAGRLAISFLGSLACGLAAAQIGGQRAAAIAGVVLLAIFVPYHLSIWTQFPLWYHLTFFASLVLLSLAGGRLARH